MTLDPLWLSLRVAALATAGAFVVGLPLAWVLARRRFPGRELASVAILLPMVLPPTVLGYLLLVVLGRQAPLGRLAEALGVGPVVFTPAAAVVAAFVAALPFLVRAAQGALEQVDPVYEDAARTLGQGELRIALSVTIPLAWRGVVAGVALAFARAMGEFGATVMLAGNIPGRTQTASVAIYDAVQVGRMDDARTLAVLLSLLTALVLLGLGRPGAGSRP